MCPVPVLRSRSCDRGIALLLSPLQAIAAAEEFGDAVPAIRVWNLIHGRNAAFNVFRIGDELSAHPTAYKVEEFVRLDRSGHEIGARDHQDAADVLPMLAQCVERLLALSPQREHPQQEKRLRGAMREVFRPDFDGIRHSVPIKSHRPYRSSEPE